MNRDKIRFHTPEGLEPRFRPPEALTLDTFQNKRGMKIRYGLCLPENPSSIIVILQGLSEFGEKFAEFMHDQLKMNRGTVFLDWAYQGGSERLASNPQKRHCDSFEDDVDDVHQLVDEIVLPALKNQGKPDLPLILYGHSTGAAIATMVLKQNKIPFKCAILSAPLYKIRFPQYTDSFIRPLVRLNAYIRPDNYVYFGGDWTGDNRPENVKDDTLSKDPHRHILQREWFLANPDLQVGHVTWKWLHEALKVTTDITRASYLREIKTPVFMATAGNDWLVKSDFAQNVSQHFSDCVSRHYDESYHEILMERDSIRQNFLDNMDTLINRCLN